MRRFETTPQKKFLGTLILFVLTPLFVLLYTLFVFNWRPSTSTVIVAIAITLLFYYFYRGYQKQAAEALQGEEQAEEPEMQQREAGDETPQAEEEPAGSGKQE